MAKKISEEKKQDIKNHLRANYTKTETSRKLGVSRQTVINVSKELGSGGPLPPQTVDDDRKKHKVRRLERDTDRKYREALQQIEDLDRELDTYRTCDGLTNSASPIPIYCHPNTGNTKAIPILVASDWHIDEVIEGSLVGHANEFNLGIARKRVRRFFSYAGKLIEICKKDSDIDTLLIAALGDFMSSWIHDELIESNSLSPPEAILELFEMWVGGLNFLLGTKLVKKIHFVGAVGNHTRITKRIQHKGRHRKSYEWILYGLLSRHYKAKDEKRISFQLPTGYFNWVEMFGRKLRFHHGDNIRYQGGIGGVHIPVRKAIAQWNKVQRADLDIFGHWHTMEWSETYVINNSLIGYSAYAENLKADYMKAGQSLFLMHSKYGKTAQFPIILQD